MGHVGLIIKATRLCNLRCTYCHDWAIGPGQTMQFPVLARLVKLALEDPEHDSVDFIWHGGEPTVLPLSFYRKALYLQALFCRPGQTVRNVLQTNGTALTPEWARFFKTYEFSIGISLDGPPEIHDRYRRYASGQPSSAAVGKGMRLLEQYGVRFTVLMVIDEDALALGADGVFDSLLELGVKDVSLIAAAPVNQPDAATATPTEHYVSPPRMTAFLSRLYDRWRNHDDESIRIRELTAIQKRLQGLSPGLCKLAGGCLGKYYLIEPNGDVAHCDLFKGDPRYTLGNITRQTFADVRSSLNLKLLQLDERREIDNMRACPEFGVCQGWCPHERYLSVRHNPSHVEECCGLRELIEHIRERLEQPADLSAITS